MGRHLAAERPADRAAFAEHGYTALQACARRFRGGGAAHVRVFLPQWGYASRSAGAGAAHVRRRHFEGRLVVGRLEAYDTSLVLLAEWAGWGLPAVRYGSRQRQYNVEHPRGTDWAPDLVAALNASLAAAGETAYYQAALGAWHSQAGAYDKAHGAGALTCATAELAALNAAGAPAGGDRAADRELRRRRRGSGGGRDE